MDTPVPIPNTEVKHHNGDDSVKTRQQQAARSFFYVKKFQQQYLFKQYDILYKYYYLLEKEGLTKDSEKLLNSYEDEYERCLNNIRHIEVESNIVAGLITSGIDDDTLENFISGLEKRDLDEKFNIDNNQLSIKISDLKKKNNDLSESDNDNLPF